MEARNLENEYVPQNIFDLHIQSIRERAISDRELNDERLEKFQAILEKNLLEYRNLITETRADFKNEITEMKGQIKFLEEKIEHTTDTLTVAINDINSRIDDMHQTHNKWFTVFGILLAAVPIAVVVVQSLVGK